MVGRTNPVNDNDWVLFTCRFDVKGKLMKYAFFYAVFAMLLAPGAALTYFSFKSSFFMGMTMLPIILSAFVAGRISKMFTDNETDYNAS